MDKAKEYAQLFMLYHLAMHQQTVLVPKMPLDRANEISTRFYALLNNPTAQEREGENLANAYAKLLEELHAEMQHLFSTVNSGVVDCNRMNSVYQKFYSIRSKE